MTKPAPLDSVLNVAMTTAEGLQLTSTAERLNRDSESLSARWNASADAQAAALRQNAQHFAFDSEAEAEAEAEKGLVKWRKGTLSAIEEHAIPLAQQADSVLAIIDASIEATKTPSHIMSRVGLGDHERQAFYETSQIIENVGVATLINQLRTAVKTGNKILACAIAARMERMTPEQRKAIPFSREQIAYKFFGKMHAELMASLLRAKVNAMRVKARYATLKEWSESKLVEAVNENGRRKLSHKPIGWMRGTDRIGLALVEKQLAEAIEDAKAA